MRPSQLPKLILILFIFNHSAKGQTCKVLGTTSIIKYEGECADGLANGKGTCFYPDSIFYIGKFESGLREGKGELHFSRSNQPDSVVKGYWSGDVFKGKRYEQYVYNNERILSDCNFLFIGKKKKQLTIKIGLAKTGTADENMLSQIGQTFIRVVSMEALDPKKELVQTAKYEDPTKGEYIYEIESYPIKLRLVLSNGKKMEFELNRPGEWLIEGYMFSKIEKRTEVRRS